MYRLEIKIFAPLLQTRLLCLFYLVFCILYFFVVVFFTLHFLLCILYRIEIKIFAPFVQPHRGFVRSSCIALSDRCVLRCNAIHCQIVVYCMVMQYIVQMSASAILSLYLFRRNVNLFPTNAYPTSVVRWYENMV